MGAAFKGHTAMVTRLLEAGADPRAKNAAGLDALGFARTFGREDVALLLATAMESVLGGDT
jgi:ankyrin repeat protein